TWAPAHLPDRIITTRSSSTPSTASSMCRRARRRKRRRRARPSSTRWTATSWARPCSLPGSTGSSPLTRFVRAGVSTAIVDGLFSSGLHVAAYGATVARLFQGVAATVLGNAAFTGGARTVAIGVLMHIGVAFAWSALFVFVIVRSPAVRRLLTARLGPFAIAAVYGPAIWMVMSLLVIPALVGRPTPIAFRWWVQFFGHI